MRIDMHSHILPGMDDGAADVSVSLEMLKKLRDDGVETVVLTPHFYRQNEDIPAFLHRREKAFEQLSQAVPELPDCPRLLLGAEVYFYPSLSSDPDFPKLCIEGTDRILLELPFELLQNNFYSGYSRFRSNCDCKIIFAHLERYLKFGNSPEDLLRLLDGGDALFQMNCSSLVNAGFRERGTLLEFVSEGFVSALGTDAHNLSGRPPLYGKAEKLIVSKCGKPAFERICARSEKILEI